MKRKICLFCSLSIMALLFMISCAPTTNLTSVWRDDNYRGNMKNVFVIGAAQKPGVRRIFEREFVSQLKTHGTNAVASYEYISDDKMLDKDTVVSTIKNMDIDAVLVSRLLERKNIKSYVPGSYQNWHSYYSTAYRDSCPPGYVCQEIVAQETNLFDARTEQLVWSAISETFVNDGTYELIKSFIKQVIDNLTKENLI